MIVQPKQQNQYSGECLYAWYPEVIDEPVYTTSMNPRDIYLHHSPDKDLLEQKPSTNGVASASNNNNTSAELLQRYKQSVAPSDLAYHSTETINEALNPPWALHYELKRRPATPNPASNTTSMPAREEPPRRLKSAPIVRSLPSAAILTIPEPRFVTAVIPVATINPTSPPPPPSSSCRPKTRASSAKARLNTTFPNESKQVPRVIKSAHVSRRKGTETKLSEEEIQQIFKRIYGENFEQQRPPVQPIQVIYTQPQSSPTPPPPVYVYQKSATWCPDEVPSTSPVRKSVQVSAVPLNPHYLHRPGVIAIGNVEKKPVFRENPAVKRTTRHHHRRHQSIGKRNEPLLALTPAPTKTRLSVEIGGVKLAYDPKLTLSDKSPNLTKYFIDGRLYLIKDQRYNVLDNIDPSSLEKYNQSLTLHQRPKYYQSHPVDKFQIVKSSPDGHYNPSETYSYNTSPKHLQRYVIDPNLTAENLNVNRMSIAKRPATATVYA